MKHIRILPMLLVLISAFNFSSCTQDLEPVDPAISIPGPNNPNNPTPGLFKASVDGSDYQTSTTLVYLTGNSITITAIRPQGDTFGFMLDGTTTGTYEGNDSDNLIGYNAVGNENTYISFNMDNPSEDTGEVIVTEIDLVNQTISGTFQFKGYSEDENGVVTTKQITNGIFTDLPYTTENPNNDTFYAKVDGVEFVDIDLLGGTVGSGTDDFIFVAAENLAGESITVDIRSNLGVGTYLVNSSNDVQVHYVPAGDDFGGSAVSGTVTVTEKTSTRIKGTFSAPVIIGTTTYTLTQGSFDVAYD